MRTTSAPSYPSRDIIGELAVLYGIARQHGSIISLKDLATLTRTSLSEEEIKQAWDQIPGLASSYQLEDGLIIKREEAASGNIPNLLDRHDENKIRTRKYSQYAREFSRLCMSNDAKVLAISGSTSYHSPSPTDDLDIFCITRPDSLWLFLTKSLLLARFLHIFRRNEPRICFSYAVDENFAAKDFLPSKDAIFARDALTAVVIHGQEFYYDLLRKSPWMSGRFPHLYQQLADDNRRKDTMKPAYSSSSSRKFLNALLKILVGNYVSLKSSMLNRKKRKQHDLYSLFTARIGPDHCIFESARYSKLRSVYLSLDRLSHLEDHQSRA